MAVFFEKQICIGPCVEVWMAMCRSGRKTQKPFGRFFETFSRKKNRKVIIFDLEVEKHKNRFFHG